MGEKNVRFIVDELNKLLGTDFNMISFDSLPTNSLIQICADTLTMLDALPKVDVEKNSEDSLTKILEAFSNMKIPLPNKLNVNEFADGIISGKRSVIHPILLWMLSNQNEVRKRAYFSKYLKKVPVPPELTSDPEIQQLLIQYDNKIQEFKAVHLENSKYSKLGTETLELRKEIDRITNDMIKINDQIEKQKPKVENIPNKESLLVSIKAYRNEVMQEKMLNKQLEDQKEEIAKLQMDIKKAEQALEKEKSLRSGSGDILSRLKEEVHTLRILVQERLPQELNMLRKQSDLMLLVVSEPPPSQVEIEELETAVDNVSFELQNLMETTLMNNDSRDDKLAQFRQHVTVIANNKQLAADSLLEIKEEVSRVRRIVEEKERMLQQAIEKSFIQQENPDPSENPDQCESPHENENPYQRKIPDYIEILNLIESFEQVEISDQVENFNQVQNFDQIQCSNEVEIFEPIDSPKRINSPHKIKTRSRKQSPEKIDSKINSFDSFFDIEFDLEDEEGDEHTSSGKMPQGDELKKYVSQLRSKSVIYKERRGQLQELQAELGVLTRTLDIIKHENPQVVEVLESKEIEINKTESNDLNNLPENTQDLIKICKDLAKQVNSKKSEVGQVRQEFQNLKVNIDDLGKKHDEAQEIYNSSMSSYNSEIKRLENEIKDLEEKIFDEEEKWKKVIKDIETKEEIYHRLTDDTFGDEKKTQIDVLKEEIELQEKFKKELSEELKKVILEKEQKEQQIIMWYSTLELLKCKKKCMGNSYN